MRRAGTAAGVAAPALLLLTVASGVAATPTYDWPTAPFSVMGAVDQPFALAFNAGLVAVGLATLPFARRLWNAAGRSVGALYAVVGVSFAGAGVFPLPATAHEVFGAGLLAGIPAVLLAASVVGWRRGDRRAGVVALSLGTAALGVWLPYDFGVETAQIGYGAAELVAFVAWSAWSAWTAARLWRRSGQRLSERRAEVTP